jgi:hypothetical protein
MLKGLALDSQLEALGLAAGAPCLCDALDLWRVPARVPRSWTSISLIIHRLYVADKIADDFYLVHILVRDFHSGKLIFDHDHRRGITRLNSYLLGRFPGVLPAH